MSVRIGIALIVGLMIGSVPISAIAGAGGGTDIERETIGNVRGSRWFLRSSNEIACTGALIKQFSYGNPTDTPLSTDLDGDGLSTATLFRTTAGFGQFFVRANNDTGNQSSTKINFGSATDLPITGNFDPASAGDEVAVYRPSVNRFFIRTGSGNVSFGMGTTGDIPIAGNWDGSGDGSEEVGLFRPSTRQFFMRSANTPAGTLTKRALGALDDLAVTGDWDGDGTTTVGVFRDVGGAGFYFLSNLTTGGTVQLITPFGAGADDPISGDWDGPSVDEDGCP